MRIAFALTVAALLALLALAHAKPDEWTLQGTLKFNLTVSRVMLSPSGEYLAVVYGDNYRAFLSMYDLQLRKLWTKQLTSYSSISFVNDSLLVIAEWLYGAVPASRVTLLSVRSGEEIYTGIVRGGFNPEVVKTALQGSTLYILTRRELIALDLSAGGGLRVLLAFANSGLQMLHVDGKLAVLAVDTNCHICLMNNEKVIVFVEPSGLKKITLEHILLLVNLGDRFGLLTDAGAILQLEHGGEFSFSTLYTVPDFAGTPLASEPDYRLLYLLATEGLSVRLAVVDVMHGRAVSGTLPLPYEKGDEIKLLGLDNGLFVAWCKDVVIVGNVTAQLTLKKIEAGFRVVSAGIRGRTLAIAGASEVKIYNLQSRQASTPQLVLEVVDEWGSPVSNYTIMLDSRLVGTFTGVAVINTSAGLHSLQVLAPGFKQRGFSINVTGRTGVLVVLEREKFRVTVRAEEQDISQPGVITQPEILLMKNSSLVARGVGMLTVNVTPGFYEVRVLGKKANASKTLEVRADTEVWIYLTPYPVEVSRNETSREQGEIIIGAENLTAVIYGSEACPSCKSVKETLERSGLQLVFMDIANKSNLDAYYRLYENLKAGSLYIIPLTLIFRGEYLVAAVAGEPRDPSIWRSLLSAGESNLTVVIRDDGSITRAPINSSEVYGLVFGYRREASQPIESRAILGVILALAAADSINPCTFMVFAALLLSAAGIAGRKSAARIAVAFVAAVFSSYLLLGLGLVNFVSYFSWARYIVAAAAVLAGGYEVWRSMKVTCTACTDRARASRLASFAKANRYVRILAARLGSAYGYVLRVSGRLNTLSQGFLEKARRGSVAAGALAGALVSFTLLPCSSGPYLVASYMLSGLPITTALVYLLLYNTIFVSPLVLIALAITAGQRFVAKIDVAVIQLSPLRKYIDWLVGLALIAMGFYIMLLH